MYPYTEEEGPGIHTLLNLQFTVVIQLQGHYYIVMN